MHSSKTAHMWFHSPMLAHKWLHLSSQLISGYIQQNLLIPGYTHQKVLTPMKVCKNRLWRVQTAGDESHLWNIYLYVLRSACYFCFMNGIPVSLARSHCICKYWWLTSSFCIKHWTTNIFQDIKNDGLYILRLQD